MSHIIVFLFSCFQLCIVVQQHSSLRRQNGVLAGQGISSLRKDLEKAGPVA